MPLNAVVFELNVMGHDDFKMRDLAIDVDHWQMRTRESWKAASAVVDLLFDSPELGLMGADEYIGRCGTDGVLWKEWFLVNEEGCTTSMPTWASYNDNWNKHGPVNPFWIDWRNYGRSSSSGSLPLAKETTQLYIRDIIDILTQQAELWDSGAFAVEPYATRLCMPFQNFLAFINSMQRLYDHIHRDVDSETVTTTATEDSDLLTIDE